MAESAPLLTASHLKKTYPSQDGGQELLILKEISITVAERSLISIIGASGSGKSTLLHILGGLDRPTSGTIRFRDADIHLYNDEELAKFRNLQIGFVFQFHHLLPEFTALENVFMPALIAGGNKDEMASRAADLLSRLGLASRENHRPAQLSGGEQQRVAVARALMNRPQIIMADEPTGNLDTRNTSQMLDLLLRIRDEEGIALLMVTHDPGIAATSEQVFELQDGELIAK